MSWGGWGSCSPPPVSGKIIFFGQSSHFSGSGQKMKNNILKIINEKYSIVYSKIKCPKSEHFGARHSDCLIMLVLEFIFRALPHIFRAKSNQSPLQKWPVRL